jgi:GntP family gluconate:H+ symporter
VDYYPLITLAVGVATVIGMIMVLRINAFIALITAAIVVSLMAPGETAEKISRVAQAFGSTAGGIGIVIALAAVIGECMMASGAADRIVLFFVRLLGEKRAGWALMLSGFVLAVPVFFDTVFYLLVPLARSMYKRTGKNYLFSLLAIAAGGAVTHSMAPPTPGPLAMAENLHFDVGMMIIVGAAVGLPASIIGLLCAPVFDRVLKVPFRETAGRGDATPMEEANLPPLLLSLLPVVLPVLMIATHTVASMLGRESITPYTSIIGNPNLAMLVSTAIALFLVWYVHRSSLKELSETVELSLMSGGVIILITSGGGAFGGMLREAEIGPAIQSLFSSGGGSGQGMTFLWLGFLIATLMKFAQGSGTVSMVTTSAMLWAMLDIGDDVTDKVAAAREMLGMHPVYLACAIGSGSLVGSWMNDSGFWIFAKMGGLTESETLRSWTLLLMILGVACMAITVLLATLFPMA